MLSRATDIIEQYGLVLGAIRIVKHLCRMCGVIYDQYLFCVALLNKSQSFVVSGPPIKIDIRYLSLNDFQESSGLTFAKRMIQDIKKKLDAGTFIAIGCYYKKRLIYVAWVSLEEFVLPSTCSSDIYILAKDEGLLLDAYCHPNFRKYGLHTYMNAVRLHVLHRLGMKKAIAVILRENMPARKSQAKVGFHCIAVINCYRIFGRRISKMTLRSIPIV